MITQALDGAWDGSVRCRSDDNLHPELAGLTEFSLKKESYFQLARNALLENTAVDFNVFRKRGRSFELVVEAKPPFPVTLDKATLAKIQEGNHEILIASADVVRYQAYLESVLHQSRHAEDVLTARRATLLKESSKILMKDLFDNPDRAEKIDEIKKLVAAIIESLFDNRDMIHNMLSLTQYDYYTYTHSVDVAVLSSGLGVAIGLGKTDVLNLGIGAMLHDIGKSTIAPVLLNKLGDLDNFEYRMIQQHVDAGLRILQRHKAIPEESYDAVVQHHEKLSGEGYPLGLRGKEITLFGRITGIADCYDAMTTNRIYKKALKPFDALSHISKERKNYDNELLQAFIKMLGKLKTIT